MRFKPISLSLAVLIALLLAAAAAYALPRLEPGPNVPHPVAGRVDCLGCHGKSVDIGEGHEGRTDDTCTTCHRVGNTTGIPAIPHPTQGREGCLDCHAAGKAKPFPGDHTFQTAQACLNCHTVSATAAAPVPEIPHPTQGREDCLQCHATDQVRPFPADHEGRTNAVCLGCHTVSAVAVVAAPAPDVPHPTQGREDCLQCHATDQVRPFPADHKGRTNDLCLGCHQASAVVTTPPSTEVIPTPISEPKLFGANSCVTCHQGLGGASAQNTTDWQASVHAAQGVGCVSCHGGDPNQTDAAAAMAPAAGFLGVPSKGQIPGLCASCHSNVELMRPYNVPIDQFEQYWQSQHGKALLTGDGNVATCFDCHGGHKVLKVQDPSATVYPTNEPAMCARCHADAALMASYNIPTNQYALYQTSVHGTAVLQNQDLRAPTCSTCHGKHGAAPPGFAQVSFVCGQCHALTDEYYLEGAHKVGVTGQAAPGCVTCHSQHSVLPPTLDLFLGADERHCGMCHAPGSSTAGQVDAIYQALKEADDAYAHAEATIIRAGQERLIVAQQEEMLQKANTPLIEARALQHTVSVADVQAKTKESVDLSQKALASAEAALKDIRTRRLAMIIALVAILATIAALVLVKRGLDRDLEAQRAGHRSSLP